MTRSTVVGLVFLRGFEFVLMPAAHRVNQRIEEDKILRIVQQSRFPEAFFPVNQFHVRMTVKRIIPQGGQTVKKAAEFNLFFFGFF